MKRGFDVLRDKAINRSIMFGRQDRDRLGLRGLLPHRVSTESQMRSRLTSDARIPSVPIVIPSEMETVLNSIGVPPAARIPAFTCTARSRRW